MRLMLRRRCCCRRTPLAAALLSSACLLLLCLGFPPCGRRGLACSSAASALNETLLADLNATTAAQAAARLRDIRSRHVRRLWAELAGLADRSGLPDWSSGLAQALADAGPGCLAGACVGGGLSRPPLPGGIWSGGASCRRGGRTEQSRLAVIVPFRDRWPQLRRLLAILHPMLQRQAAGCYRVFVAEQYGCGGAFNKGRLNNAGFLEALRLFNFTCAIFQDADIVPESDETAYECGPHRPKHLAVALDIRGYRLPYAALVGGVIAFTTEQYFRVNGYSNLYWGWGLEDDDMELRMKVGTRLQYDRPPAALARFRALPHPAQRIYRLQADRRGPLLQTAHTRFAKEGLNTVRYRLLMTRLEPLYTHLLVDIGEQPSDFDLAGLE